MSSDKIMVNLLQQPPKMQPSIPIPQKPKAPPKPPTLQDIQNAHSHLSYSQQMLDGLIKLPDSELTLGAVYGAAADMVHHYQLTGGKQGVSPADVVKELSSPDFPTVSPEGVPPSADDLRTALQRYFDQAVQVQAAITAQHGSPQQIAQQALPQNSQPPAQGVLQQ